MGCSWGQLERRGLGGRRGGGLGCMWSSYWQAIVQTGAKSDGEGNDDGDDDR